MPADDSRGGIQDVLRSVVAVCIREVIGSNENDHSLRHVDGRELSASLHPPQEVA